MKLLAFILLTVLFISTQSFSAVPSKVDGSDVMTGKAFSLDLDKQKTATAVIFISAKCPCSMSHVNHLKELAKSFPQFQFVGVLSNINETPDLVKTTFASAELPFPIVMDTSGQYATAFEAVKTPHVFVVGKDKKILFYGGVTDSSNAPNAKKFYLKDALTAIAKGETPPLKEARALGCYIQRE